MARAAGEMTLFVPHDVPGFVDHESGGLSLRNILVPMATRPRGEPALEAAALMVQSLGLTEGTFHVLHVGKPSQLTRISFEAPSGWKIERIVHEGDAGEVILETADSIRADLIAMITEGPNGFLDALRGSTSERVLRGARCPLVNLPASQWFSRVRRFWTG